MEIGLEVFNQALPASRSGARLGFSSSAISIGSLGAWGLSQCPAKRITGTSASTAKMPMPGANPFSD